MLFDGIFETMKSTMQMQVHPGWPDVRATGVVPGEKLVEFFDRTQGKLVEFFDRFRVTGVVPGENSFKFSIDWFDSSNRVHCFD